MEPRPYGTTSFTEIMTGGRSLEETNLRDKTCFFCGHRDLPEVLYPEVQSKLEREILALIGHGVIYFGVGAAVGFDTLAALTVLKLKRHHPQVKLALILPCKNHDFGQDAPELFEQISTGADKIVYTAERYFNGCMYKRNRQMAGASAWCVCYLERDTGTTAYTVNYAQSLGVRIVNLAK